MRELYAKGKRGLVYKEKNIMIKTKNPKSTAPGRIQIEAQFLKKLNKYGIGPKFIEFSGDELFMEYINGILFEEYIKNNSRENIKEVIKNLLKQLNKMDKLGINKEEMHHPFKHIIIRHNVPILIDFERCNYTKNPKNVTQFIQYLTSNKIADILGIKGITFNKKKLIALSKEYKKTLEIINIFKET